MNFIVNETEQKLRGGYYTPLDLARFCTSWALGSGASEVLEPSCGDGAFISALSAPKWPKGLSLRAFEISEVEAEKARQRAQVLCFQRGNSTVMQGDFLEWAVKHILRGAPVADAVIGNPPYIRYQYLPSEFQNRSEQIFELLRLPFTKHTNAWVPFILASLALMRPGGRLAMVIPSEIVHVMHAAPLRSYLAKNADRIAIIDPAEIWFTDTLQGAVILLVEKAIHPPSAKGLMTIIPITGREFASEPADLLLNRAVWHRAHDIDGKWTLAAMPKKALEILTAVKKHPGVVRLDEVAEVDVGIVTGANKFFLVTDEVVEAHKLQAWAHPMFGRSEHCPGILYDKKQHQENAQLGHPTNFLWFDSESETKLHAKALEYIRHGEGQALHTRYKCRIRAPWYRVPSVYATPLGMLKRSHDAPRMILNTAGAYSTDTAYRLTPHLHSADVLSACFHTSLTALCAEIEGRYYGGGVLELVPSEIERMLICLPKRFRPNIATLDKRVRAEGLMNAIEQQSTHVLGQAGFTPNEQQVLLEAWHYLRLRRQRISAEEAMPADEGS
jgi:adenine-specific DNA-methyltransferase